MQYVGIDPGVNGGVAVIDDSPSFLRCTPMPETEREFLTWMMTHIDCTESFAMLELVGGYIQARKMGDGSTGQTGVTMFKFGTSYGACRMALTAVGLYEGERWETVRPQQWRKAVGAQKGATKAELKEISKRHYPAEKITLKTADAVLLAVYCRSVHGRVFSSSPTNPLSLWG